MHRKKCTVGSWITECALSEQRLDQSIKQTNVCRDLFGQVLGISLNHSLDIEKVLTIRLRLYFGVLFEKQKNLFFWIYLKKGRIMKSQKTDVAIFDGYFLLHVMKNIPATCGNISKSLMQIITTTAAKIIVITFDTYPVMQIKNIDHSLIEVDSITRYPAYDTTAYEAQSKRDLQISLLNWKTYISKNF